MTLGFEAIGGGRTEEVAEWGDSEVHVWSLEYLVWIVKLERYQEHRKAGSKLEYVSRFCQII